MKMNDDTFIVHVMPNPSIQNQGELLLLGYFSF